MTEEGGRVVTFYSFKGGVGRTMALANTAFLAATNGLRVLVMDWDLEAPGVPYYFRGQLEAHDEASLAMKPGILDMVTQWTARVKQMSSSTDADALTKTYENDEAFRPFVSTLIPNERFRGGGCLDAIVAGASKGGETGNSVYEQTLSDFSWPNFFNHYAGGLLIQALRNWARSKYDLVLVDSRTGFADVAGICTVQLPDIVALCFIMNRQNIDGTAKVAAAIKRQRDNDVEMRLIPMRLSREGTSEEADAQAFARGVLRRVGLLGQDLIASDLERLRIRAADGVPFYETLAPFGSTEPRKDPLTLDYATVAEVLIGRSIEIAPIDAAWRDFVRRRLEPRQATLAYLAELEIAEPNRAREEIEALIASANHSVETGRKLDDAYVDALIKATFVVAERPDVDFEEQIDPYDALLTLMRRLFERQPDVWRLRLADVIERTSAEENSLGTPEDEAAVLEDIDTLLAGAPATAALGLRRARLRHRVVRTMLFDGNFDEALRSIDLADSLLNGVRPLHPTPEELREIDEAIVQSRLLKGDAYFSQNNGHAAVREYKSALMLAENDHPGSRTVSDVLFRLVRGYLSFDPPAATEPALRWTTLNADSPGALSRLSVLVDAVSSSIDPAGASLKLTRLLFSEDEQSSSYRSSSFFSRFLGVNSTFRFLVSAAKLIVLIPEEDLIVIKGLIVLISQISPKVLVRGSGYIEARYDELRSAVDVLISAAALLGLEQEVGRLNAISEHLVRSVRRQTPNSGERDDGSA
ncbi:KGGVGR-motif variant AAA ATPase [Methylobacterium sp. HMF5984]|uniref:KGGVGR-motif variant AAA ATPase n=1 Tax=Methylobacterium sp. HMF5984 TaxID=3367370 RepID=UPI00385404BB